MSGLWTKPQASEAATIDTMRKGLATGTWLQLSPQTEQPQAKWLSLSPKSNAGPAVAAEPANQVTEELSLDNDRFLSNHDSGSRSSSVSSVKSISTKAQVFRPVPSTCEREVIGLARFRAE